MDHGFGISSSFLHLSEVLVKPGDEVEQGDMIGKLVRLAELPARIWIGV